MTFRTATLGLAIAALGTSAFAFDLEGVKPRVLNGLEGTSGPNNISNVPIANAPLAAEGLGQIAGYNLRTRSWNISGDTGIVPLHSHADRPAIVFTLSGEIFEYRSDAPDRILHSAGGLSLEEGDVTHWWLNEGPDDVRLLAFDVFRARGEAAVAETPAPQEFVAAGEPLQGWVWQGAVTEHRSDADAPVTLAAEEGAHLGGGAQAYWQNTGDVPAELFFGVVEPLSETDGVPQVGVQAHHAGQ